MGINQSIPQVCIREIEALQKNDYKDYATILERFCQIVRGNLSTDFSLP